jgi:hypothetical protein
MDCKLIPGDPGQGAYTCGMFDEGGGHFYYIDTRAGTWARAFNTDDLMLGGIAQIFAITADGRRLVVPVSTYTEAGPAGGIVALLDITSRSRLRVLSVVDLGPGSAPHNLVLTRDEKRVIVSDYFLHQGDIGKIHFDGDKKIHVLNLENDQLSLDTRFNLDFGNAFADVKARPHGLAVK